MTRFHFTSRLHVSHQEELESLLYFNPQQRRVKTEIERAVEDYGKPEIETEGESLRVSVGDKPIAQCLFALDQLVEPPRVAGLILYLRQGDSLVILHVAVSEDYSTTGPSSDQKLVLRMLAQVREVGKLIRGVRYLNLLYRGGLVVPVRGNGGDFEVSE